MAEQVLMRHLARWYIWLGWLIGVPLAMWTITGLVMVSRPIEEVRGNNLRKDLPPVALPAAANTAGRSAITTITYMDDTIERFSASGITLPEIEEIAARLVVAEQIDGGKAVVGAQFLAADETPIELRRPFPSWRIFNVMWGLHIMDLQRRDDSSHPIPILFAALTAIGSIIGCVLLFRRRSTQNAG